MRSLAADAACAAASVLNGACDWPLRPPAALFFTYQTRLERFSGTVTLNLSNRVWYVKNNAAGGRNGQSQAPFNTLAAAQAASAASDLIFAYTGGRAKNRHAARLPPRK